jgi:hypothetical protein
MLKCFSQSCSQRRSMDKPRAIKITPVINGNQFAGFRMYFSNLKARKAIEAALAQLRCVPHFEPANNCVFVETDNMLTATPLYQFFSPEFLYTASVQYSDRSILTHHPVVYLTFYGVPGYDELRKIGDYLQQFMPGTDLRIRQSGHVWIMEINGPSVAAFYKDGSKFRTTFRDMLIAIP